MLKICRILYFTIIFSGLTSQLCSQDAYKINWQNEASYLATGIYLNGIGYGLMLSTPRIEYEEFLGLDPTEISQFDQVAFNYFSPTADRASDYLSNGSIILPALVYMAKINDRAWRESSVMLFETFALQGAFVTISKYGFRRYRPFVYESNLTPGQSISSNGRASFISGHTCLAASNSFFAAAIFQKAYPDSPLVPYVYGTAALIPAATGYLRVRGGRHFPTDTIAGYIAGAAAAAIIIQIHKRDDIQLTAGAQGIGLVFQI